MIYFKDYEVTCKCGCGYNYEDPELCYKLEKARHESGVRFTISSWCRCAPHNEKEGGSSTSSHVQGEAVDIT